jgi:hypothetical protein
MKAKIEDRSLGTARGVNIELPESATVKPWFGINGRVNGIRIEHMSRACVRELGQALIDAAREHALECDHDPDD